MNSFIQMLQVKDYPRLWLQLNLYCQNFIEKKQKQQHLSSNKVRYYYYYFIYLFFMHKYNYAPN